MKYEIEAKEDWWQDVLFKTRGSHAKYLALFPGHQLVRPHAPTSQKAADMGQLKGLLQHVHCRVSLNPNNQYGNPATRSLEKGHFAIHAMVREKVKLLGVT